VEPLENLLAFVEVDFSKLVLEGELGAGTFGAVHKSRWNGMAVAVKVANCTNLDETTLKLLRRELRVHASPQARHERIVALFGASTVAPNFALVMEYAPCGTLYDLLHAESHSSIQRPSLTARVQMLYDIAAAVQHLHLHRIVHGDIKSSNVLVFEGSRVKICDFGLAAVNNSKILTSASISHSRGTPVYMASEVLFGGAISYASDVYSYSMLIYEMMTEKVPFAGVALQSLYFQLAQQARPDVNDTAVRDGCAVFKPLLQQCWQQDAQQRPHFSSIVDDLEMLLLQIRFEPQQLCSPASAASTTQQQQQRASSSSSAPSQAETAAQQQQRSKPERSAKQHPAQLPHKSSTKVKSTGEINEQRHCIDMCACYCAAVQE
jgi:serine/threonine protein kinase